MAELRVWRVLDANANRAAEALRTLEDVARLVREDLYWAQQLKAMRHELTHVLGSLDRQQLLAARSTADDAGTQNTTGAEAMRDSVDDLVTAEVQRLTQALRVLEEFSKLIDTTVSEQLKQLRYRSYDQLAQLELAWTRHRWLESLQLCILIDCSLPLEKFVAYLTALCTAGARCVQVRDKQREGADLVAYARQAVEVLSAFDGHVIVNDRVDVALASGAAGVHVGQEDLALEDVRRIAGSRLCVGVSTHNIEQARVAEQAGADYIGCGPSFPSRTKPFEYFPGVSFLRQVAGEIGLPSLAIGGIGLDTIEQVMQSGIRGAAVSAAVHRATDPAAAVSELCRRLNGAA